METTNQFLDQVKVRHGLPSDYALATKLGITRAQVSKYRNRGDELGDETALKVAELLDLDPGYVLACMNHQRTKSEAARAAWEQLADLVKRHGVAAALVLFAAAPGLTPTPANAAPLKASAGVCILC